MSRSFVPSPPVFRRLAAGLLLLAAAGLAVQPALSAAPRGARARHGMVVSVDDHATRVGLQVLRNGGNAVDAAIAVAFALNASYPLAAPVGGGGFMLYRTEEGRHMALDFRELAPVKLRPELFFDGNGQPVVERSLEGGLAVGVPGTVAGLAEAHQRWGSLPWAELIRPAVRLAADGIPISGFQGEMLAAAGERLVHDAETRKVFTRDGVALAAGQLLVQKELAGTLTRIAEGGAEAFYQGPVAEAIVATVRAAGGVMELEDLLSYEPLLRKPIQGRYRGYRIISFPPPSSGGIALLQMLGMLERYDLAEFGPGSSLSVHLVAEVERRAFADRSRWLGDADFYQVPVRGLLRPRYLARRAATIEADQATPSGLLAPGKPKNRPRGDETLHLSVADAQGRAVSMTLTLNSAYGTGLMARGTGVLLNNEMDDFALAPGIPNQWGLLGGQANAVEPGKRPLSSMTPTIVELPRPGPRPFLVLGSPGGAKIITSVLQVIVNVIDHEMTLQEAVSYPRFHHQWFPDVLLYEHLAFPADVDAGLRARGQQLEQSRRLLGNVNAIALDSNGNWIGVADPRRGGSAAGH